jgi:hypothetical protein
VYVWGTKGSAAEYSSEEGSDLEGLHYAQVDVSDPDAIQAHEAPFKALDVLVLAQGIVIYDRSRAVVQALFSSCAFGHIIGQPVDPLAVAQIVLEGIAVGR